VCATWDTLVHTLLGVPSHLLVECLAALLLCMPRCWETDPSIRPSFQDILMELRRMRARHKAANPVQGAWRRSRTNLEQHSVSGHALAGSDNDLAAAAAAAAAAAEAGGRPPGSPVAALERAGRPSLQLGGEWEGSRSGEGPGAVAAGLTPAATHGVGENSPWGRTLLRLPLWY
jgi:hypothetical protein